MPKLGPRILQTSESTNSTVFTIGTNQTYPKYVSPLLALQYLYNDEILQVPDPRNIQIQLTGFLQGKNARIFVGELWELLVSAQENIGGIPTAFLEKKKEEIRLRKVRINQSKFPVIWMFQLEV